MLSFRPGTAKGGERARPGRVLAFIYTLMGTFKVGKISFHGELGFYRVVLSEVTM